MLSILVRKCAHFATGIWECVMCYIIYLIAFQLDTACIYSSLGHFLVCESAGSGLQARASKVFIGFGQWRIQGGGTQGTFPPPPLEPSNAVLLGCGLAVATYISLTSHLLPLESRLLAS